MSSNIQTIRICSYCNREFVAKTTTTRYCSHSCNRADYKKKQRENKILKSEVETTAVKIQPSIELMMKTYYKIEDLSQLFGLSKRTIYRIIERGELPHAKLGGKIFVHKETIENLFKK